MLDFFKSTNSKKESISKDLNVLSEERLKIEIDKKEKEENEERIKELNYWIEE